MRRPVPLGHPDFGKAFPCRCVLQEGREQRLQRLQRYSNLGTLTRCTFASLMPQGRSADPQNQERFAGAVAAAQEFAENPQGWLLLCGPSGCGKTHLAAAIANRCIEAGQPALFMVVPDLLDHLRATYRPESEVSYDELFEQVRNAPLLILDDLGGYSATPWAREKFFQLVNHRFSARLPTVFTTALAPEELEERLATRLTNSSLARVLVLEEKGSALYQEIGGMARERLATMTFDNFDTRGMSVEPQVRRNLEDAVKAARGFAQRPEGWLVLLGETGCGKTHLAAAIANYCLEQGQPTLFAVVPDLLDHLRSTFNPESPATYSQVFERVRSAPLLILDDLGAYRSTPWAHEKLYQIVNYRYLSRLPTVITSDLELEKMEEMEHRLASRLADPKLSLVFKIDAPDYRIHRPAVKRSASAGRRSGRQG